MEPCACHESTTAHSKTPAPSASCDRSRSKINKRKRITFFFGTPRPLFPVDAIDFASPRRHVDGFQHGERNAAYQSVLRI